MGESNDEQPLARDRQISPKSTPDTTRRDAIARCLAARICDERKTVETLRILDAALSILEDDDHELVPLIDRFRNDRLDESVGDEHERAKRRTHNAAADHFLALVLLYTASEPPVGKAPTEPVRELDLRVKTMLVDSNGVTP